MGRIIVKKVRGMSLWGKGALTFVLTLLISIFMYQGWLKPMLSRAAVTTYYLNDLPSVSVGVDGSTNLTASVSSSYDVVLGGPANQFRGLMSVDPPTGTNRIRVYDSTSTNATFTDQEFYRTYTPAYTVDTRIDPNALAEFECYVRSWTGTPSASVKVQLFDYNPATGAVVQIGTTVTKTLKVNTTALQRFVNGTSTAANFGNAAYKVVAGHRLQVRYLVSCVNADPCLLVNQAASAMPSGTSRLIVTETPVGDVTVGNGTAEPATVTIGPSPDGTTSYALDTFSLQLSSPIGDTIDTVEVTLAAGMSPYITRVLIASSDNSVTYGSLAAPTSGDVWTIPTYGLIPTTTLTNYHVRIVPKGHADVPMPPGGTYAVTGRVTAVTHSQLGTITMGDSGSATLTIDNSSPADASWGAVTPGNAQVALNWSNPGGDFAGVVILRNTLPTVGDPTEGRSYAVGSTIGTAQVIYVGSGTTFTDTSAANGTDYYYMIHSYDSFHNYAVGVTVGPVKPVNPNMTNPGVPSAIATSSTTIQVTMPYTGDPNANNTYSVSYRVSGAGAWTSWGTGSHTASPYTTTITGLDAANLYDVQCIYNDADGVNVDPVTTSHAIEISSVALPAYAVTPGDASADAIGTSSINIDMPYTNDLNGNSTYKVEYKLSTDGAYKTLVSGGNHSSSPYATAIAGLTPGATYNVRLTYQDADGVSGGSPAVQTFTVTTASVLADSLLHNSNQFPGTTKWGGNWGTDTGQYGSMNCTVCHQPSADNIKALRSVLNPPAGAFPGGADSPVVFQNVTSMGNDTDGRTTSQRVCETCHSQNKFHNYNATTQSDKSHYNLTDCVACHPHNRGFKASCDMCHGLPPLTTDTDGSTATGLVWRGGISTEVVPTGATNPASTGAHLRHANSRGFKCDTCHKGTPMPTVTKQITIGFAASPANTPGYKGSVTMGNFSGHTPLVNGYSFVSGAAGTTVSTGATYANSCSVACHGNWPGSGGSVYRPSWVGGSSQATCGACHGTDAATAPTIGSHTKHASNAAGKYAFACTTCHPAVTDKDHVNGSVKIMLNSGDSRIGASARYKGYLNYSTGAPAPSAVYGACTSLYCHSDGQSTPTTVASTTWGTTLGCTGCHGNYNTTGGAGTALSGKHQQHVNNATVFGTNTGFGCEACHAKTVSNSTTVSTVANHVNKFIDYSGAWANNNYDTGTKACTNLYCHSNGNRESIVYVNPAIWTSAATYSCNGCHGTSKTAGEPDYANGGAGTSTANSHAIHVARLGITNTTGCLYCHVNTVDSVTANKLSGAAPMRHLNGTVDVNPGGTFKSVAVSFTYNSGTGKCATISCHGNTDATWGGSACTGCHSVIQGNRVAVKTHFDGASHHVQSGTVTDDKCYQCHWESDSSGYLATAYHGGTATSTAGVTLVVHGAGSRPITYAAGAFVAYTSGGASNSTRAQLAKINTHCISCHKTANDAYTPFGDGKTPKQYAWDNTSVDARYSQTGTTTWGKYATTANASQKNITKAYSAHGKATSNARGWDTTNGVDGTITNTAAGAVNVLCFDCHNSHGTAATGVMSSYSSVTGRNKGGILKSTTNGKGGYTATYTPTTGGSAASPNFNAYNPGADLCFDCHNTQTKSATIPWGYNSEFGVTAGKPVYGYWDTANFGDGLFGSESRYAYKASYGANKGGHFGKSSAMNTTPSKQINGLCTPCHDPHGVSTVTPANQPYMVPLLKGTWVTSPYKEDSAPSATTEDRGGSSSRGPAAPINTSSSTPNYHIDQNTFQTGTTYWALSNGSTLQTIADTNFAGLCLQCHPKASINPNTDTTWKSMDRVHNTVDGWGGVGANASNAVHAYTCSKCHTPHNSRLPRLMVTNCLDAKHRNRTASGGAFSYDSASGSRGAGGGRGPMGGGGSGASPVNEGPWFFCKNSTPAQSTSSNIRTCHNVAGAGGAGTTDNLQQWNSKTLW